VGMEATADGVAVEARDACASANIDLPAGLGLALPDRDGWAAAGERLWR